MLEIPSLPNSEVEADWAEMCVLFSEDGSISQSDFRESLSETTSYSKADRTVDNIWQELMWRHEAYPKIHPILPTQSRLVRIQKWTVAQPYSFMLLLARSNSYGSTKITIRKRRNPSKLFERLVSVGLKEYFGRSINPGHPPEGRFSSLTFRQSVSFFSDVSNEDVANPQVIRRNAKDEGADVIAWRPIDRRSGQAIILVQCTIGDDWTSKVGEISLTGWQDIINFSVTPIKAMAFPCIYHDQWNLWSKRGGILFDRLRLTSLFAQAQKRSNSRYLERKMKCWTKNQIAKLPFVR
jgi:hypothetical protein